MPHRQLLKNMHHDMLAAASQETVIVFPEGEWDETTVDYSDREQVIVTQTDEHGITHTIVLSASMMTQLRVPFLQWLTANQPD